eukprot:4847365-Pleurochrysis_carterae.AAC.2
MHSASARAQQEAALSRRAQSGGARRRSQGPERQAPQGADYRCKWQAQGALRIGDGRRHGGECRR